MVCRSVQDERPNSSTSGGQSAGGEREDVAPAGGVLVLTVFSFDEGADFAMAIHEATEVQERHLELSVGAQVARQQGRTLSRLGRGLRPWVAALAHRCRWWWWWLSRGWARRACLCFV